MFRQGDVLVRPLRSGEKITGAEVPRDNGRVVLAHGEATGHAHALGGQNVVMFRDAKAGRAYLRIVGEGGALVHEEHTAHNLPPGDYEVVRQVEYDEGEARRVAD